MGELRVNAPLRQLALVMTVAIALAAAFYCLVILAASMSLPRAELLAFDLPVARALAAAFDSVLLGKLVLLAGLAGLITTWNAIFFAATRVAFALGRARMIPHVFARVHPRFGSPAFSVLFVGLVGAGGALLGRNAIVPIVGASSIVLAVIFILVVVGTIRLRSTHPDVVRPYKAPGGLPYLVFALVLAILIFGAALFAVVRGAVGVPNELIALGTWTAVGILFWVLASGLRREISDEQRRWLLLE
jgi:amino acid transporter